MYKFPKLHKREIIVRQANADWLKFYMEWTKKYDLTFGEVLSILAQEIAGIAKWTVRAERHPGHEDRLGGLE